MDIIKNKNKILAIIMVVLLVTIAIAGIILFNQNTLKQLKDTYTHEAGQELILNPTDFFDADEEKAAQITFDTSAVNKDMTGEYTAIANFKGKSFEIKVTVVDTTAPMVELSNRYVFTNDIENANFDNTFAGVYDASEWSAKLIRFEYADSLKVMDDNALKSLTDTIPVPCDAEELKALGTEEIPSEPGIYRAVLEIADVHGNTTLEEVYVIYDTTGARIDDAPDKVVTVSEEDLDKEPTVDKNDYFITDNVDGVIDSENINCELELRDAENHEWLVHVSYTDRAGNESKAEFLITVEEGEAPTVNDNEDSNTDNSNNDTTNNTGSNNGGTTSNNGNTNNAGSGNYDPADTNQDGVVTDDEAAATISPSEQKVIDAGYGNVVLLDSGNYAVLTHGDGYVNGKDGSTILREYLAGLNLEPSSLGGCWIDSENDWYWYIARDVHEIDTSGQEWTDDGEIEFID